MAARKTKPKRRDYSRKEGTRQINVPVKEEVYQRVRLAAAGAVEGGMQIRYWIERALAAQASLELGAE
jgi:hypothetical protein